jgi:hypothetical protein
MEAARWASGAAGSGSEGRADDGRRRLQAGGHLAVHLHDGVELLAALPFEDKEAGIVKGNGRPRGERQEDGFVPIGER